MPSDQNIKLTKEETLTITIPLSRFFRYVLGDLESVIIEPEEGKLLELIGASSIHVQWHDIDTLKPLNKPRLWNIKYWLRDESRRANLQEQSRLQRVAVDKLHSSILNTAKLLSDKTKMPLESVKWMAQEMVTRGDLSFLKALGININEWTEEEKKALGDLRNYTIMK